MAELLCGGVITHTARCSKTAFLNRRAAARYRALASNYTGPREILLELINNLNIILYLSTCYTVHIIVLILFMIMPQLIINTYVSLMYELKKIEKVNLLGPVPSLMKKEFTVSQRLRNNALEGLKMTQKESNVSP